MARSLKQTVDELRVAASQITAFRKKYICDTDAVDRLFEFSVFLERVDKLAKATKQKAVIVPGKNRAFARKPGDRANFNRVQIGRFLFYFGVKFLGRSGASHAPDIAVAHQNCPDGMLIAIECKMCPGKSLDKAHVMAFASVLIDLSFVAMQTTKGRKIPPGARPISILLRTPSDADVLYQAFGSGRSYLVTTAGKVAKSHRQVARHYGFQIDKKRFP